MYMSSSMRSKVDLYRFFFDRMEAQPTPLPVPSTADDADKRFLDWLVRKKGVRIVGDCWMWGHRVGKEGEMFVNYRGKVHLARRAVWQVYHPNDPIGRTHITNVCPCEENRSLCIAPHHLVQTVNRSPEYCSRFLEDLKSKCTIDEDGCWRHCHPKRGGYAYVKFFGRTMGAHVASYLASHHPMESIPEGQQVRHMCKLKPNCCRPECLDLGNSFDQSEDKRRHGTLPMGDTHANTSLSNEQVKSIYRDVVQNGKTKTSCAEKYGVPWTTVFNICTGRTWRHVTGAPAFEYEKTVQKRHELEKIGKTTPPTPKEMEGVCKRILGDKKRKIQRCTVSRKGVPDAGGYVRIRFRNNVHCCHRLVAARFYNNDVLLPRGVHVAHLCDNPSCVNELHLLIDYHGENTRHQHEPAIPDETLKEKVERRRHQANELEKQMHKRKISDAEEELPPSKTRKTMVVNTKESYQAVCQRMESTIETTDLITGCRISNGRSTGRNGRVTFIMNGRPANGQQLLVEHHWLNDTELPDGFVTTMLCNNVRCMNLDHVIIESRGFRCTRLRDWMQQNPEETMSAFVTRQREEIQRLRLLNGYSTWEKDPLTAAPVAIDKTSPLTPAEVKSICDKALSPKNHTVNVNGCILYRIGSQGGKIAPWTKVRYHNKCVPVAIAECYMNHGKPLEKNQVFLLCHEVLCVNPEHMAILPGGYIQRRTRGLWNSPDPFHNETIPPNETFPEAMERRKQILGPTCISYKDQKGITS